MEDSRGRKSNMDARGKSGDAAKGHGTLLANNFLEGPRSSRSHCRALAITSLGVKLSAIYTPPPH